EFYTIEEVATFQASCGEGVTSNLPPSLQPRTRPGLLRRVFLWWCGAAGSALLPCAERSRVRVPPPPSQFRPPPHGVLLVPHSHRGLRVKTAGTQLGETRPGKLDALPQQTCRTLLLVLAPIQAVAGWCVTAAVGATSIRVP